ncbi:CPBP family intramembrane glutamic endopeptidase [Vallitalea okinawensis]|uniref:CPBP family intramembrane glutamic endopeptidase n=1 Tax=Vallitalea okinawensis TaxID=2078660 RepID=UPI000CFD9431|nr:type II CAAX endopeptidase family protein [Vallitalea okinawensis]
MFYRGKLFEEAKKARYVTNIFLAYLLVFVFMFGSQILTIPFFIIITILPTQVTSSGILELFIMLIISFSIVLFLLFLWVKLVERRPFRSIGFKTRNWFLKFLQGFGLGFLLITLVVLCLFLFGMVTIDTTISAPSFDWSSLTIILLLIPAWSLQSSTEEAVARGWLMHILGARYKPVFGLLASALAFGVLHLFNAHINFLAILNIIIVGLFLGLLVIKQEHIWTVCGIHAAWNWAQGNIYGFQVSGNEVTNSLLHFKSTGPEWITGGAFGPEAGIVTTILFVVASYLIYRQLHTFRASL